MITMITGTNFKGLSFSQPLKRLNLVVAPNGTGKSARTQALTLARMGYIPGQKTNQDIFNNFGSNGKLIAGFEYNGFLFERKFQQGKNGAVSQKMRYGERFWNMTKAEFAEQTAEAPNAKKYEFLPNNRTDEK